MDQTNPSWRVFDAPAAGAPSQGGATAGPTVGPAENVLGAQPLALLGVVGAVGIGVIAIALALSGAGSGSASGPQDAFLPGESGTTVSAGPLVVDVTGAVEKPGLYRMDVGARVGDAIEAAGGFSPRVDAERVGTELNLAATLTDGAQVRVPSRDDVPIGGSTGGGSPGGGGNGGGNGGGGGGLVDLNSASQSELEALPGIGPVTATKIIEARTQTPFRSVDELRERGLVGEKTFESLKSLVTAG